MNLSTQQSKSVYCICIHIHSESVVASFYRPIFRVRVVADVVGFEEFIHSYMCIQMHTHIYKRTCIQRKCYRVFQLVYFSSSLPCRCGGSQKFFLSVCECLGVCVCLWALWLFGLHPAFAPL